MNVRSEVIFGHEELPEPGSTRAIVKIGEPNSQWCSGTIVGLNPLTILSAAHCLDGKNTIRSFRGIRAKRVVSDCPRCGKMDPDDPKYVTSVVARDAMILIFPPSARGSVDLSDDEVASVAPLRKGLETLPERLSFCGYGTTGLTPGTGSMGAKLCGQNSLVVMDPKVQPADWEQASPEKLEEYASLTAQYYLRLLPEFLLLKVSLRPGADGKPVMDPSDAMSNMGDSGGPLFWVDERKVLRILGVNSVGYWSGQTRESAAPMLSGFAPLTLPSIRALLKKAVKQGADIRDVKDLLKDVE